MASSKPARMFPIILDISKLNDIMQILKQYRFPEAKWFEFGLNLGLLYPTLEAVEANHKGNTSRCLMECLSKWLSKADENVHPPTWQTLADALRKLEAKAVAENIEKTMISQLLQHYSSRISQATLCEESVDLLHTEGLISEEILREVKSCGYTLTDDAMREIYTAVANGHNKLKAFPKILCKTEDTVNMANELLQDIEKIIVPESFSDCTNEPPAQAIVPTSDILYDAANYVPTDTFNSRPQTEIQLYITQIYNDRFDKMTWNYGSFYFKITRLVSTNITVDQLEDFKEYISYCCSDLSPQLATSITVKDVMKVVKTKCNVINIAPVEEVVSFYSITEANPLISDYKATLDEFCHTFKLQFLLDKKLSTTNFLVCETIEFVLDWDPAEHLLNDIRRLMEKAFKGLSRRIIVKSMHKGNSIIIICGAPTHLMNALQLRANDNLPVLQEEFALMRLKIGHCKVYDRTIRNKKLKIFAEEIEIFEGELIKLNSYHNDKESLLDDQAAQLTHLKQKQEFIDGTMQASGFKIKQIEREKAANTKKRMLLKGSEHLQSTLRIRISRKEVLQYNEQEIEELQESISSVSVWLLEIQSSNSYNKELDKEVKFTHVQTVLSSNGSICEAQDDYNHTDISFKKGEFLKLSTNGHEIQSLETGQKSVVPMKYIGYSMVELLYLFQFAMTAPNPLVLDDDDKEMYFIQKITDDPTLLRSLRKWFSKQKLFVASYNFERHDVTLKKGEVLRVVENEDDRWWYIHSLHTDNSGYVPINHIIPIKGKYSQIYYKYIYFHIVSPSNAEKQLIQANTQAGTFLIRNSKSNPGRYTLSVYDGVTTRHYRIKIENYKYYINPRVRFDSLNDLIHHYMLADGLHCSLTVPIPKHANIPIAMNKELEINKSSIKISKCIHAGQFGETWEGNCKGKGSVMIKTNIATNITQETFLEETNILEQFYHKNIISLYGVCTEDYPFYIVTEPINQNLRNHVHMNNATPAELVDIAIQVVDGMIYLGEQDYIHCDLRAENILLRDRHNTVKIANFHLAQHLKGKKYWTAEEGTKLALKWTAPEWHTLNHLSIKSDVWSFGILLWEMVSKEKKELYPGMTNEEVWEAVSESYPKFIPKDCPEPFKQLMPNCWKQNDDERPNFNNILVVLINYR